MSTKLSKILVTGGAGYIGSHTARQLVNAGYDVTVVDTLYSGHSWAVPETADFHQMDAGNLPDMARLLKKRHMGSMNLIRACRDSGIEAFIFSSSAAVYGNPEIVPVSEDAETKPINPYGRTKLITEWNLRDLAESIRQISGQKFNYVALRYFNVAGASLDGTLGQATHDATHLIKVACETALGKRKSVSLFGTDYNTPDGTCIRDYIHVEDLASAHLAALRYLEENTKSQVLNCGYGKGYSVREVLDKVQLVSGAHFPIIEIPRRIGDPEQLIANNQRILNTLQWVPNHNSLEEICRTAWEWEKQA